MAAKKTMGRRKLGTGGGCRYAKRTMTKAKLWPGEELPCECPEEQLESG